jgi:hypothetical protein
MATRARLDRLVLPAAILALSACAPPHGTGPEHSGSPATPVVSATPLTREPLIAVLDRPFGAAPNTLRLLRPDGVEVAETAVDPDAEAITAAGPRLLIAGAGKLQAIERDGTSSALPTLPGDATNDLVRGLVAKADGSAWLWSSVSQSDSGAESRLYLSGPRTPATLLLDRHEAGTALQPVAWTAGGPVVSEEPLGIGGYVLFRRTFGAASLLDVDARTLRPLASGDCAFSDLAVDGTVACVSDGREGPHGDAPVTLHLLRGGHAAVSVALPASMRQAGAALFRPGGGVVSLAMSPALGEGQEQVETDLVDVASGARHAFGPAGVMPAAWLPDGRLVAVRLPGVVGGGAGTYVVAADGSAALISPASTVVGILL